MNVKKGQFLGPWDIECRGKTWTLPETGNILLTENAGRALGYNTLVTDMRSLPIMSETGCPVVIDATHRRAAARRHGKRNRVIGTLFPRSRAQRLQWRRRGDSSETHQDPDNAPSDGPNMGAG